MTLNICPHGLCHRLKVKTPGNAGGGSRKECDTCQKICLGLSPPAWLRVFGADTQSSGGRRQTCLQVNAGMQQEFS